MLPFNVKTAQQLRKIGTLLEKQKANPFRYKAYFNAAFTLEELSEDVRDIYKTKSIKGLVALPAIGEGIASSIEEYINQGHISKLDNLQGASDPVKLFQSIPTVGHKLANDIYKTLHINSLAELEYAAYNGQLDSVKGLGLKRKLAIMSWLTTYFSSRQHQPRFSHVNHDNYNANNYPDVSLLLKLDTEYREKARLKKLPLISPKRFNPDNKNWLPILHKSIDNWHFTILYSNTRRAHQLATNLDWVIIYFYNQQHQEGQYTVVTETRGNLIGKRVVRGREKECVNYYANIGDLETETTY